MKVFGWTIAGLVVLYIAWVTFLLLWWPNIIYKPTDIVFEEERVSVSLEGLEVDVLPGKGNRVVLYLQGNTGKRSGLVAPMRAYQEQGFHVVSFSYPGTEGRSGKMNEKQMREEVLKVFDNIPDIIGIEAPTVFVHGYSLGANLAVGLAASRELEGVVLQAPAISMCEVVNGLTWGVQTCILNVEHWDVRRLLERVEEPVLIIHGGQDKVVSRQQALWIEDAVPGSKRIEYETIGHTGFQKTSYLEDIFEWIEGL